VRAIKRASKEEADKLVGPWIDVIQCDVKQDCAESSQEPRSSAHFEFFFSRCRAGMHHRRNFRIKKNPPPRRRVGFLSDLDT